MDDFEDYDEFDDYEDDDTPLTIEECVQAIHAGEPELSHLVRLASAVLNKEGDVAPEFFAVAIEARMEFERDIYNGGLDQAVWNHGPELSEHFGEALDKVGAIENGQLILKLAKESQPFLDAVESPDDVVEQFSQFRIKVGGPNFPIPDLDEELFEAVMEFALENPEAFSKP